MDKSDCDIVYLVKSADGDFSLNKRFAAMVV